MKETKYIGTVARMWADNLPSHFVNSWTDMIQFNSRYLTGPDELIHYDKATVSYHVTARNSLVERMQGEWILMLDTDHAFWPDIVSRMLHISDKYGAEVMSAIYQYKFQPHFPVGGNWTADNGVEPIRQIDFGKEVQEVGVLPGGCILIRKKALQKVTKAFPGQGPFDIIGGLSEDYSFCWRCKEAGVNTYLAPQIECHHVIPTVLSVKDLQSFTLE